MSESKRQFAEPAMRPPQEMHSLLLRATQGCTYNDCHFCYVSRGYPFMAATPEELEAEAVSRKAFCPADTAIYLTGSNPYALPRRILESYCEVLRRHYPAFSRISMQARVDDIAAKTDEDLRALCKLGISHLYIGTENGNEEVLKLMNKGHTARDTVEQLKRLDANGIAYTAFYVLGLGGKGMGRKSGEDTAAMFNQLHPVRITTTGMTLFAEAPVAEMARRGEFTEASEREKIEELQAFLKALEIDVFYDGIHYLNPVNYRFANGDAAEKQRVLDDIAETIDNCSDADLEAMVNRRMMTSL